jgi:invasion protein IalB
MTSTTERLLIGAGALAVGLLVGWAGHGLLRYSTGTETVTSFQDWRTACPAASAKDASCEIIQDIVDNQSHNQIARVALAKDNGKPVLGVTLPLGVLLPAGAGIQFGTDPVKRIDYRTCNTLGCIAELTLDDKLQASLDAGKDGRLLFAGLDGKPVAVPLTLKGFADAQKAYRSNEAKRGSWFWRMW